MARNREKTNAAKKSDSLIARAVRGGCLYTLCVLAMGVVLILWPSEALEYGYYIAAGLAILLGLLRVIRYFRADMTAAREQQLLASGAMRIILGVLLLICAAQIRAGLMDQLCAGVMLMVGSIRLQAGFDLKRRGHANWFIVALSAAVIALVLGLVALLFRTSVNAVMMLAITLCIEAVADLLCRIKFLAIERKARKLKEEAMEAAEKAKNAPPEPEKTWDPRTEPRASDRHRWESDLEQPEAAEQKEPAPKDEAGEAEDEEAPEGEADA